MTTRGFLLGFLTAGILVALGFYLYRPQTPAATSPGTPSTQLPAPEPPASQGTMVEMSDEDQKRIGVQTTEVRKERIQREIVAPARVAAPETALRAISARIGGRIDRLLVN